MAQLADWYELIEENPDGGLIVVPAKTRAIRRTA
jgi:hypothetical protein